MKRGRPSQTQKSHHSKGREALTQSVSTHTHRLAVCERVSLTATQLHFLFFFKWHSHSQILIFTLKLLAHVHAKLQFGLLRLNWGKRERRGGGRKKDDVYVNGRMHEQTGGQALEHFKRKTKTLPPPRLHLWSCPRPFRGHVSLAAPEEPSDRWVQPSVQSLGLEDERRLLVVFL